MLTSFLNTSGECDVEIRNISAFFETGPGVTLQVKMRQHIQFSGRKKNKTFISMNVHLRYVSLRKIECSFVQYVEPLSSPLQSPHFRGSKSVTALIYSGTALTDTGGDTDKISLKKKWRNFPIFHNLLTFCICDTTKYLDMCI